MKDIHFLQQLRKSISFYSQNYNILGNLFDGLTDKMSYITVMYKSNIRHLSLIAEEKVYKLQGVKNNNLTQIFQLVQWRLQIWRQIQLKYICNIIKKWFACLSDNLFKYESSKRLRLLKTGSRREKKITDFYIYKFFIDEQTTQIFIEFQL